MTRLIAAFALALWLLTPAWEDYDLDLFSEGLDDAIDRLDDLADRDCD